MKGVRGLSTPKRTRPLIRVISAKLLSSRGSHAPELDGGILAPAQQPRGIRTSPSTIGVFSGMCADRHGMRVRFWPRRLELHMTSEGRYGRAFTCINSSAWGRAALPTEGHDLRSRRGLSIGSLQARPIMSVLNPIRGHYNGQLPCRPRGEYPGHRVGYIDCSIASSRTVGPIRLE